MYGKEKYARINALLNRRFEEKKALIAVHRGSWGGNIIENTVPAFRCALDMGADMFEVDVSCSIDGVLYAFHDGGEWRLFHCLQNIKTMPSSQIEAYSCRNCLGEDSGQHVQRIEEVVAAFDGGELYNIDRSWFWGLDKLDAVLARHPHAQQQAVIKTPVKQEYLEFFNACPNKYMYMPIVYSMEEVRQVLSYPDINVVGAEVIAFTPDHELFQQENLDWIRSQGLYLWVNVINLGTPDKFRLFTDLDDDNALADPKRTAWRAVLDRGVGVLQTDWPVQASRLRDAYFAGK